MIERIKIVGEKREGKSKLALKIVAKMVELCEATGRLEKHSLKEQKER